MKTRVPLASAAFRKCGMALLFFFLMVSATQTRAQSCQAWFMFTADTTVNPNVVTLFDSSFAGSGTITNWQWMYNGAPVGTNAPNQTLNVTVNPGDVICLTITTDSGCVSTWCDTVTFTPPCNGQAAVTWSGDSLGIYMFTATVTGMNFPVTYFWNASNGASGTTPTFVTQFSVNGLYNVCFQAMDMNGCSASWCDTIVVSGVTGCQGCVPQIVYTIDSLNPNLYTFTDTTTYLSPPTSDNWQVNGVSSGSGSSITVTLPNPGTTYNVCHNVNVAGCSVSCPHNACRYVVTPQTPGIHVTYFNTDSSTLYCIAPTSVNLYLQGSIHGYTPGDTTIGVHVNFGDGTDTNFLAVHWQTYFYVYFSHVYTNPGNYQPQVIVYSPDSLYSDTALIGDSISITNNCAPLSGQVYFDYNQNCIFDSGDYAMPWRSVTLTDGAGITMQAYTNANGFYAFNVPTGHTYTVTVNTYGNWYSGNYVVVCPVGGSHTVSSVPSSNNNFFLGCPSAFDLTASISGWGFVPGRNGSICVYPVNHGCATPPGQVVVILDPQVTLTPDSNATYTVSGDTVTWNTMGGSWYYQSYCLHVVTDSTATIGDSICVTVIVTPIAGDSIPSNNTIVHCWAVRTSWDPNDKTGVPEGVGAAHAVRPEQELTYTIRFQNTGTATAEDIYILDSLDADLDINSYEVIATSHPVTPAVLLGNILRFSYPDINLPDSNVNEPMSHGYVTYRISPLSNVAHGAIIQNTADIYFDFNPSVRTNSTVHTIDFFLGLQEPILRNDLVTVYPNPAHDRLWIALTNSSKCEVKLYDATGRLVIHQTLEQSGSLDVQSLHTGLYTIQVIQNDAMQNARLIIAR